MSDRPMYRCPECREWAAPRRRLGFIDFDDTACEKCGLTIHVEFFPPTMNGQALSREEQVHLWTAFYTGRYTDEIRRRPMTREEARIRAKKQRLRLRFVEGENRRQRSR